MRMLIVIAVFFVNTSYGQFFQNADSLHKKRLAGVVITETTGYVSSLALLNYLWYQYYPRTSFHAFNDNPEWLQLDKAGHVMTSYYLGHVGYAMLKWSGVKKDKALWYGATLGSFYLLSMEVLDGFSTDWGFSWGDILANTAGTAMYIAQEKLWDEQRIQVRFSTHLTPFASYRPELLGNNTPERLMKDYNGHTYWLSGNIASFLNKETRFPKWLNLDIGYGGEEMVSGRPEDNVLYPGLFNRYRQWYISPGIDFTKIPTRVKWLKPVFGLLNMVKFPAPTLEFSKKGIKGYFLYF